MRFKKLMPFGKKDKDLSPYDTFLSFKRDLDTIFERTFDLFNETGGIRLDAKNDQNQIVITADVPGFTEKDISLNLDGNLLTIKAERAEDKEEKSEDFYLKERTFGSLSRSLQLPFQVDQNTIEAELDKGVLKINIPKPKEIQEQSKQIPIKKK